MFVLGLNGSPRKNWNSDRLLQEALAGAEELGAKTEKLDLYDLSYSGCRSCFACKRLGGTSFARCAWPDDLKPVLDKALASDLLIVAAPIYFRMVPGMVRCFYERLLYPSQIYARDGHKGYRKDLRVGLVYTMNVDDPALNRFPGETDRSDFERLVGPTKLLNIVDTCQFDDYSLYASERFDAEAKLRRREAFFGRDCVLARSFGRELAEDCLSVL